MRSSPGPAPRRSTASGDASIEGRLDPELIAASREVDRTLLRWALGLSPRERLRSCSRAANLLLRFRRV